MATLFLENQPITWRVNSDSQWPTDSGIMVDKLLSHKTIFYLDQISNFLVQKTN